jgi:hypothetical protein
MDGSPMGTERLFYQAHDKFSHTCKLTIEQVQAIVSL